MTHLSRFDLARRSSRKLESMLPLEGWFGGTIRACGSSSSQMNCLMAFGTKRDQILQMVRSTVRPELLMMYLQVHHRPAALASITISLENLFADSSIFVLVTHGHCSAGLCFNCWA